MTIKQLWNYLEKKKKVFWYHEGYQVYIEDARKGCEFQENHFTFKKGKILTVRHLNGFGSILHKSELSKLFVK